MYCNNEKHIAVKQFEHTFHQQHLSPHLHPPHTTPLATATQKQYRNMSGPPPNQPGGPTATDEEIFEAYRSNEAESEPEDVEELPTVAPAARPRAAKRKKPQQVDEDDGYGSDLYYDEDDRAELMAKTQLEREMILAKRAEERINRTERQKLLAKSKDDEPAPKPPARKRPDAKRQAIADIRKAQQRKKTASTKAARWVVFVCCVGGWVGLF